MAPEIAAYFGNKPPLAIGDYSWFFIGKIYDYQLWSAEQVWSWNSRFALRLVYHIDADVSEIVETSLSEMNSLSALNSLEKNNYGDILKKLLVDVKSGDSITALYQPSEYLSFYHNGHLIGKTSNMMFAKRFLDIWFNPKNINGDMRCQLLKDCQKT
ncbi:MAG: chalcone isomerase family protein [Alphaproteobacteria bacterium]